MVKKLFASTYILSAQKKECYAILAGLDKSDMLGRTLKYCEAANPELDSKSECFNTLLSEASDAMSLQHV